MFASFPARATWLREYLQCRVHSSKGGVEGQPYTPVEVKGALVYPNDFKVLFQ